MINKQLAECVLPTQQIEFVLLNCSCVLRLNAGIDSDQLTRALKLHSIEDSIEGDIVPGEVRDAMLASVNDLNLIAPPPNLTDSVQTVATISARGSDELDVEGDERQATLFLLTERSSDLLR